MYFTQRQPGTARASTHTFFAAVKIAKEYEKKGGDYENEQGSKNKAKKGAPESKSKDGMFQLNLVFVSQQAKAVCN